VAVCDEQEPSGWDHQRSVDEASVDVEIRPIKPRAQTNQPGGQWLKPGDGTKKATSVHGRVHGPTRKPEIASKHVIELQLAQKRSTMMGEKIRTVSDLYGCFRLCACPQPANWKDELEGMR
jgi:hypothetical protein